MSTPPADTRYILILSCEDVRGIVAAVTTFLADHYGFIIESAQYGDGSTNRFFLRIEFAADPEKSPAEDVIKKRFHESVAEKFNMEWAIWPKVKRARVAVLVSQHGHCLNDLLYRHSTGQLAIDIPAVISNHPDFKQVVEWHNIPFYHFSLEGSSKEAQERLIRDVLERHQVDTVVLARYMQILSAEMCEYLNGRAINIHHSFLPSFKGARPYHQAYEKGVKLIGATAHYVTTDLDEGPIIEQEVARVDHTYLPADLTAIGRDIECQVLARALKYHIEHRVLLNGHKTVIFR